MSKIVNKKCGNCGKIVSVLCSEDSTIIGVLCPACKFFDLLKKQSSKTKPSKDGSPTESFTENSKSSPKSCPKCNSEDIFGGEKGKYYCNHCDNQFKSKTS